MSDKVKTGLVFGITMAIFFIAQHLLFSDNITAKEILKSIISGVIGGAVAGFLFVWLLMKIGNSQFIKKSIKIEIDPNEELIFETAANHFKGIEAVGGKLFLTGKKLIFKSHQLNIQKHELVIRLSDIKEIVSFKALGLTNNGLYILTKDEKREKFVVEKREELLLCLEHTEKEIMA